MSEKAGSKLKRRLFLTDILRILCALQIYMYHSGTMYGCTYGHVMDALLRYLTSPVMTCFFILSGFLIHYQHDREDITADWIRVYLKKRLISVMPSYLLVVVIWPLVYPDQIRVWALLLPVDLSGIQTSYRTLFGILHNGGTWFVSCMLFCYVSYPVVKAVAESAGKWVPVALIVIPHFLLMYSNVIIPEFSLDGLYSNPIARTAEFIIGVAFAEIVFRKKTVREDCAYTNNDRYLVRMSSLGRPFCTIVLLVIISAVSAQVNHAGRKLMVTGYLVIPAVLFILLAAGRLRSERMENSRLLLAMGKMSYQFFLTQLFLWNLTSRILWLIRLKGNTAQIVVSFTICILISFFVWRFFDRPVKRYLNRKCIRKQ